MEESDEDLEGNSRDIFQEGKCFPRKNIVDLRIGLGYGNNIKKTQDFTEKEPIMNRPD